MIETRSRRLLLGPPGVTGIIVVLTGITIATFGSVGATLAWLLLGLTAGYALSGSA
jgi:hypothetical protein